MHNIAFLGLVFILFTLPIHFSFLFCFSLTSLIIIFSLYYLRNKIHLEKGNYHAAGEHKFILNPCGQINSEGCSEEKELQNVVAVEMEEGQTICSGVKLARYTKETKWMLLDPKDPYVGVRVQFMGGDSCLDEPTARPLTTTINFACDESNDYPDNTKTQFLGGGKLEDIKCTYEFAFRSAFACPKISKSVNGFVVFLFVLVIYIGGGMVYKKFTLGTSGLESCPNIDFWRSVWNHIARCWNKVTGRHMGESTTHQPLMQVDEDNL